MTMVIVSHRASGGRPGRASGHRRRSAPAARPLAPAHKAVAARRRQERDEDARDRGEPDGAWRSIARERNHRGQPDKGAVVSQERPRGARASGKGRGRRDWGLRDGTGEFGGAGKLGNAQERIRLGPGPTIPAGSDPCRSGGRSRGCTSALCPKSYLTRPRKVPTATISASTILSAGTEFFHPASPASRRNAP